MGCLTDVSGVGLLPYKMIHTRGNHDEPKISRVGGTDCIGDVGG